MSELSVVNDFAKRLTGSGRGAVAVIRFQCSLLSGSHPADQFFRSVGGRTLSECKVGKITYGDWRQEDVVVVRTSATEWEVNCHGGPAPVRRILTDLQTAGIRNAEQPNSEQQTADIESPRKQWRNLLLNSPTIATADLILGQPEAFKVFVERIQANDDSEQVTRLVKHFLSLKPVARHLVKPWVVAIVGRPNAGKSSFLNAVVGYQRSIVFDQPGTTRDLVQCDIVMGGWPVQLVDTAGIRDTSTDDIEQQGIQAARKMIQSADLCVVIYDQSIGWTDEDQQMLELAQQRIPVCVIHNKSDLPENQTSGDSNKLNNLASNVDLFEVSSTTGKGIRFVVDWIAQAAVPIVPKPSEPLPILTTMVDACESYLAPQQLDVLRQKLKQILVAFTDSPH